MAMKCFFALAVLALISENYGKAIIEQEGGIIRHARALPPTLSINVDTGKRCMFTYYQIPRNVHPDDARIQSYLSSCKEGSILWIYPPHNPIAIDFSEYSAAANKSYTICLKTWTIYNITDVTDGYQPTEFNFRLDNPRLSSDNGRGEVCIPSHGSNLKVVLASPYGPEVPYYGAHIDFRRETLQNVTITTSTELHGTDNQTTNEAVDKRA